jgi:hypothetical protein
MCVEKVQAIKLAVKFLSPHFPHRSKYPFRSCVFMHPQSTLFPQGKLTTPTGVEIANLFLIATLLRLLCSQEGKIIT